ncbi:cation/H(+) antiporter 20 [Impatiens glandulifera]|uniref:cation/H(+) antiporter 20 n=1 Tax=Impatiens glandulifera TaxID=253017 RepID=UPI001FB17A09|nr:cation/H(+) antiporter 20 [Impatiens glandulifera]
MVNITSIKTSSNGIWQGDSPLDYAFPLLILQTILVVVLTRFIAFLLKPLRQPKVIAEILGGILLGPSAFGRNKQYFNNVFPTWSIPILESVASIGLLFFLFLVGLELDLSSIRRTGRHAIAIAAAGISLPFLSAIGVASILRSSISATHKVGFGQFVVFMGVALSITAFPVLARILAELKLLTTRVGETAMAAAAFNDVVAWILLALAVALAGSGTHESPLVSLWVLLSGVAFVLFMMVVVRPLMSRVARRCSPEHDTIHEPYICLVLVGVMASGFVTDFIGIHSIFGAFIFGLTIPKGEFADRLMERIEDFVSGLLLPLYFASSGLKTDVAKIRGAEAWGLLALVISTACAGKVIGTFVVAMMCRIPARESITLGVLMNTKGLVELIVLNIGKEKKVLNDEVFAIMVLMALFTTFITTPTVMAIYKPARSNSAQTHRRLQSSSPTSDNTKDELRILACLHGPGNVPSLINLIESARSTNKLGRVKLYIMHLMELSERSSSIAMFQRARQNGFPSFVVGRRIGRTSNLGNDLRDRVAVSFQAYGQLARVSVRPTTAVSPLSNMHVDICHVAEDKRVTMIILPFHKQWRKGGESGDDLEEENVGHAWRGVNQRVMKEAPCSVGLLVDRGYGSGFQSQTPGSTQRVCFLFFGGPDDREALELASRMAEHPAVKVNVVRFVRKEELERNDIQLRPAPNKCREKSYSFSTATMNRDPQKEKELDEETISEFQKKWEDGTIDYKQKTSSNIIEQVLTIGRSGEHDLIVVGKGRFPSTMVAELAERQAEHAELGPIGDALASSNRRIVSSVLVIQQHDIAHVDDVPVSKNENNSSEV